MGLDITHNAFHGAYSAFNRFRQVICEVIGGSFPYHKDIVSYPDPDRFYVPNDYTKEKHPGIYAFLEHSDCDGCINYGMCKKNCR